MHVLEAVFRPRPALCTQESLTASALRKGRKRRCDVLLLLHTIRCTLHPICSSLACPHKHAVDGLEEKSAGLGKRLRRVQSTEALPATRPRRALPLPSLARLSPT